LTDRAAEASDRVAAAQHVFNGRRPLRGCRDARDIAQQPGRPTRWIDMLPRHTPKRVALVVIAGLAVLAAFCMHGWTSNRPRPGEPARSA
jgi:hypothetical protein